MKSGNLPNLQISDVPVWNLQAILTCCRRRRLPRLSLRFGDFGSDAPEPGQDRRAMAGPVNRGLDIAPEPGETGGERHGASGLLIGAVALWSASQFAFSIFMLHPATPRAIRFPPLA
jgi:hypothetical protein